MARRKVMCVCAYSFNTLRKFPEPRPSAIPPMETPNSKELSLLRDKWKIKEKKPPDAIL